jgi:hypothetical protein
MELQMREVLIGIGSAAGAAFIIFIVNCVRTRIMKRYHSERRESTALSQIVPAVNALLDLAGPNSHSIIAILEALQGNCNGNVSTALKKQIAAQANFEKFLNESARVDSVAI